MPMIPPAESPERDETPVTVDIYMRSGHVVRGTMRRHDLRYWSDSIMYSKTAPLPISLMLDGDAPAFLMDCVGFRIVPVSEGGNGNGL